MMTMSDENKNLKEELLKLLHLAVEKDQSLRTKYKIGDKFRFIRDRLSALQAHVQESLASVKVEEKSNVDKVAEDELVVYVYLYNTHGATLPSWRNMMTPKVFYEYSVNRPIYQDKTYIETFIRSKANRVQHAYLTVAVKKEFISSGEEWMKDSLGHPLIKVREGSLSPKRLIAFTHNATDYILNEDGEFIKK